MSEAGKRRSMAIVLDDEDKSVGRRRQSSHSRISNDDMFVLASSADELSNAEKHQDPDDGDVDVYDTAAVPSASASTSPPNYRAKRRSSVLPPFKVPSPFHHSAAAAGIGASHEQVITRNSPFYIFFKIVMFNGKS